MLNGEGVCGPEPLICNGQDADVRSHLMQLFITYLCLKVLLTTVLEVERELEGLLESTVGAGGSHLQNHREFSESREAHTHQ